MATGAISLFLKRSEVASLRSQLRSMAFTSLCSYALGTSPWRGNIRYGPLSTMNLGNNMAYTCDICGKGPLFGQSISRRGRAKKQGGVGRKITGVSKRVFRPNLQRVRVLVEGVPRRMRVCTHCIRSGKVAKVA